MNALSAMNPITVTKGAIHLVGAVGHLAGTVTRGGLAHEPRGGSRDEEHGDAALKRAEVEQIADEAAAAVEGR